MSRAHEPPSMPRARLTVSSRELGLALVVLAIGAFMTIGWLGDPDPHTVRRLAIGIAALLVGAAVVYLSVHRACSACGSAIQTFSFRTAAALLPDLERSLVAGDGPGAARCLNEATHATPGAKAVACSLSYCGGCRGLLALDITTDGERRTRVVTGTEARAVVPAIEAEATAASG